MVNGMGAVDVVAHSAALINRCPHAEGVKPGMQFQASSMGFLDGEGENVPSHLPSHTTFDLALGKSFGERLSFRLTALNLTNHRYLLDNSNTFGGTHYINPREISIQLKYRFRY